MPTTTEYEFPYPGGSSPTNVPGDMQALADKVEEVLVTAPTFTAVTYNGAWTDYGAPYEEVGYAKLAQGVVQLRGSAKHGTTSTTGTIFTLPAGFRPAATRRWWLQANSGMALLTIDSAGVATVASYTVTPAGSAVIISFDGVSFDTSA